MAESQQAERTEPATPKRREDARRKGQVAQSRDVGSVLVLTAGLLAGLPLLGVALGSAFAASAIEGWRAAAAPPASAADFHAALLAHGSTVGLALLPWLLLLMLAAALGPLLQIGPLFSLEALKPRFDRMDPIQGLKRMVDADRWFDLMRALGKTGLVIALLVTVLRGASAETLALFGVSLAAGLAATGALLAELTGGVLALLALLALADLAWRRHRHEKKLRMTLREVRDEARQREGSPQVRSRRRALQLEVSRSRMIAAVADADVVIANPTHYAVALCYERGAMRAPRVVAKGRAHVALRIRRAAERHGVPIVEDAPLARALHRAGKLGREIPEALFEAVAEVLAAIYRADPSRGRRWEPDRAA